MDPRGLLHQTTLRVWNQTTRVLVRRNLEGRLVDGRMRDKAHRGLACVTKWSECQASSVAQRQEHSSRRFSCSVTRMPAVIRNGTNIHFLGAYLSRASHARKHVNCMYIPFAVQGVGLHVFPCRASRVSVHGSVALHPALQTGYTCGRGSLHSLMSHA